MCLDNNQTSEEGHQENAGIEEEGEESADQQLIGGNNKRSSIISPAAAAADRVSSIITVAGRIINL